MNFVHLMKKVALATLCVLSVADAQDRRFAFKGNAAAGGTFVWSVSGEATASDSLRIIQGSNMTITQSGNTLTIASTGGAAATDYQAWYNESGDSVIIYPGSAIPFILKALTDTLLSIGSGGELQITNDFDIQYLDDTFGAGYFTSPTSAWAIGATGGDYAGGLSGIYFIYQYADTAGDAVNLYRMIIDDDGKVGFGTYTAGQAGRAHFNVLGRASSDTLAIFSNNGGGVVGDSAVIIRASGNIQSGARAGFGVATSGQAARAILNVSGFSDTLAVFIGDANKALGDSSTIIRDDGSILIRGASPSTTGLSLVASGQIESALGFRTSLNAVTHTGSGSAYKFASSNIHLDPAGANQVLISPTAPATQAYVTIRNSALADTLWMARNDVNSTLDSTAMVFADGSGYFGGNNLYLGEWRFRVGADSLVIHHEGTQVFAILPDGSTADLVAGVPPNLWHKLPPHFLLYPIYALVMIYLLLLIRERLTYARKVRRPA